MSNVNYVSQESIKQFAGSFPTGVAVITVGSGNGQCVGLTMNAVTSLSVDPAKYIICVDNNSNTLEEIRKQGRFCINFLSSDQKDVAMLFASKSAEKGEKVDFMLSELGNPLINGAHAHGECSVEEYVNGGDHTIIVGGVERVDVFENGPLLYYRGKFSDLS
ncbi:flavin reductase family protein [Methylonatrum kenyense]|uniref:flavin reductase family protein n=1 Tax=Methylonatrum kenyense TaxID=455253 RepID=UPI0020C1899C|nr:flavin reductase family protein [Methylonatrum kenyense]MCK8517199.1 flavin reductase family protein [Methylonatrum kenyense]